MSIVEELIPFVECGTVTDCETLMKLLLIDPDCVTPLTVCEALLQAVKQDASGNIFLDIPISLRFSEAHLTGENPVVLEDTVWDDLRVPAQNTKINPAKSEPEFASWIDGLFAYHFKPGNDDDESIHFAAQLPHTYKEGTDIEPHIHWSPDSNDTGDVVWEFEYTIISIGGTFPATTTDTITVPADGTPDKHQVDSFAAIDGTGIEISAMIVCRLTRRGDDVPDDFTGNAVFLEFDFHLEIDSLGSRLEFIK